MYCKTIAVCIVFLSSGCKSNSAQLGIKDTSIDKNSKTEITLEENPYSEVGAIPIPKGFTTMCRCRHEIKSRIFI